MRKTHAQRLLAPWRLRGHLVVHVQHDSATAGSPLAPGSAGHNRQAGFEPRDDEWHVTKQINSAFIGTALDERLRAAGVSDLVVAGLTTDHCVSTSVRMAGNLGYRVRLAGDATAMFDRRAPDGQTITADVRQAAHLASPHDEFCTVCPTTALLAQESA
ncbi:isochorismatase family protein [Salinisphaera sp. Q1T1-3]|uniref:isochorismatase family protein n=1 Tax=Salinisphaera sp. Q1T1-3 TaxID=2321229 RepID=UPI000E75D1BD|nr:isochorismatase family protein [Salinisphaera sp. Q1T1-3]RJS91624.1 isochorismatase family protein [Salinisphaera sp. Q1T1-3]